MAAQILKNGRVDWALLQQLVDKGYELIAADGAVEGLVQKGYSPSAVIGDMDSLDQSVDLPSSIERVALEEQDTTDFEKCLYSTVAPRYVGLGFLGRRLDHSLASLSVLTKYAKSKRIVLVDEVDLVFAPDGEFRCRLPVGSRFSIFPLNAIQFERSEGLVYPLNDLKLEIGGLVGTSNETNAPIVRVSPKKNSGSYAILFSKVHLWKLLQNF